VPEQLRGQEQPRNALYAGYQRQQSYGSPAAHLQSYGAPQPPQQQQPWAQQSLQYGNAPHHAYPQPTTQLSPVDSSVPQLYGAASPLSPETPESYVSTNVSLVYPTSNDQAFVEPASVPKTIYKSALEEKEEEAARRKEESRVGNRTTQPEEDSLPSYPQGSAPIRANRTAAEEKVRREIVAFGEMPWLD
jgi:hypothetical protein